MVVTIGHYRCAIGGRVVSKGRFQAPIGAVGTIINIAEPYVQTIPLGPNQKSGTAVFEVFFDGDTSSCWMKTKDFWPIPSRTSKEAPMIPSEPEECAQANREAANILFRIAGHGIVGDFPDGVSMKQLGRALYWLTLSSEDQEQLTGILAGWHDAEREWSSRE